MRIATIRHFLTLADTGSFYSAADKLFISPQGLNKEITRLEEQLDMALFHRNGRAGVSLTVQGTVFYERAKELLEYYDGMVDDLMASAAGADIQPGSGHLEIVATFHMLHVLLLGKRSKKLPRSVKLTEMYLNEMLPIIDTGTPNKIYLVEMYPTGEKMLKDYPDLVFEEFYPSTMGLLWKEGLAAPLPPVITREEVHNLPMVTSNYKGTRAWLEWVFRDWPLTNVMSRGTMPAYLFHMAQEGFYAMCDSEGFRLAQRNPGSETDGLRHSVLDTPEATLRVGVIHKQGVQETDLVRTYTEVLRRIMMGDL